MIVPDDREVDVPGVGLCRCGPDDGYYGPEPICAPTPSTPPATTTTKTTITTTTLKPTTPAPKTCEVRTIETKRFREGFRLGYVKIGDRDMDRVSTFSVGNILIPTFQMFINIIYSVKH